MTPPPVPPASVTVFSDIVCGWATVALHRFRRARTAAGLDGVLHPDLQPFLLRSPRSGPAAR